MSDSKEAREEDPSPAEESVGTDQEVQPSLPHEEKQTLSAPAVSSWWRTTSLGDRGVLLDRISELECTVASLHERLVDSEVARSAAKSQLQQAASQYNDLAAQYKESTARYESRIKVLQDTLKLKQTQMRGLVSQLSLIVEKVLKQHDTLRRHVHELHVEHGARVHTLQNDLRNHGLKLVEVSAKEKEAADQARLAHQRALELEQALQSLSREDASPSRVEQQLNELMSKHKELADKHDKLHRMAAKGTPMPVNPQVAALQARVEELESQLEERDKQCHLLQQQIANASPNAAQSALERTLASMRRQHELHCELVSIRPELQIPDQS